MWKNIVEPGRPPMTIWLMRIACWVPKAANTHSEYVTPIAFPLQQWLSQYASSLCYTCNACLVANLAYLGTVNSSLEVVSLQWHDTLRWFMKDSECIRHSMGAEGSMKWKLATANLTVIIMEIIYWKTGSYSIGCKYSTFSRNLYFLFSSSLQQLHELPPSTTSFISLVNAYYMFRWHWPSAGVKYVIFKTQNRMYVWMRACMHACMFVCMHACMYVCIYVCMHVCMYVRMYIYIYMCVCVYIYIYICVCVCVEFFEI